MNPETPLPSLHQVQNYIQTQRTPKQTNVITLVIELLLKYIFDPLKSYSENESFVYGLEIDDNGKIILGDGSEISHLRLCYTSKKLLMYLDDKNQNGLGLFHIDATYSVNINGFKLLIFGRSDIKRVIHPIAFMLTSHEDNDYTSLI